MLELPLEVIEPILRNAVPSALSTMNSFESISNSVCQVRDIIYLERIAEKEPSFTVRMPSANPRLVAHCAAPQLPVYGVNVAVNVPPYKQDKSIR